MTFRALATGLATGLTLALLWPLATGAAWAADVFAFGYLQRANDPAYAPHRAYTGLVLRDRRPRLDGARAALRESRVVGRALGLEFALVERPVAEAEEAGPAIENLLNEGVRVILLDLPLEDVTRAARSFADRDVILFNVRHRANSLRGRDCSPVLFHTIPSDAMLMDGLAQYLVRKAWTDVLVLEGESAADKAFSAAFQASARKFGVDIVEVRPFVLGNDPRRRDQHNVPLLTGGVDHDVIFLADTHGEFGRYVPYGTYDPRPIVGGEGLVASAWHWTWERHGAPQLNQRFDRIAGRPMTGADWAAWAAVKSIVETLVRSDSRDIAALRATLTGEAFVLDTYKGAPGGFRPWNNQLRQAVLLHTHNAVIARAPVEGFLHRTNTLDTLGADEGETKCRFE